MKAWIINRYGGQEVLEFSNIEKPEIKVGKILVEVHSVSLNPYDYKIRNGIAKIMTGNKFPIVLGGDFAGVVVESKDKKGSFTPGQEVYGFANIFFREQGALAEFTSISPKYVRLLPKNVSLLNACAIPSAGLTALNGLQKCGDYKNKKVLINGATGGIGHLATQIVVAKGGIVTAVCSTKNVELAKELGASKVIDYNTNNIFDDNDLYDVIYDAAAKLTYSQVKKHLNKSGTYCTTQEGIKVNAQSILSVFNSRSSMSLSSFRGKMEDFEELETLMSSNGVKPYFKNAFTFDEVDKAFELLENGGFIGKLVIKVKE
ncbi:MAG: NAD(P)-dependent alcohol dehydrogenase [Bacteroidota bacterium]